VWGGALPRAWPALNPGSSGRCGELLHLLPTCRGPLGPHGAGSVHALQDFAREANRGWDVGVFATLGEAVAWFEKDGQIEGARTSGAPGFNARAALDVITR